MISWSNTDEYLCGKTQKFVFKNKIASFDLDGTITVTKSKKRFPISADDWEFFSTDVPAKMKELLKQGFCIIIISNQGGLKSQDKKIEWVSKLNNIQKTLNIELMVFCSVKNNQYRKPLPCFFTDFFPRSIIEKINKDSFYCGDACGRKGDHSDTDYKFAKNCKITFKTPEMLFYNDKIDLPQIKYPNVVKACNINNEFEFETSIKPEMIIMVGYPASGKSSISRILNQTYSYEIISQDSLKTKSKCIKYATELIKNKKSLVIDNTNPDKQTRKDWIDLATSYNYTVRLILLDVTKEIAQHNNIYRYLTTGKYISSIVYNIYKSKYDEPNCDEGIKKIIIVNTIDTINNVDTVNNFFGDMYLMYLY
jgi:bifunctional polynucleotide phosphatase/kinase